MNYRGYTARYEVDAHDNVLSGQVDGIRDVVTFVAPTLAELEHEFHVSVDEYLSYCAEKGLSPEPPPGRPLSRGSKSLAVDYKGYTGTYEVDLEDGVLHGYVDGIEDIITFEADNLADLEREFRISVDDYLEWCAEDGAEPERPSVEARRAVS